MKIQLIQSVLDNNRSNLTLCDKYKLQSVIASLKNEEHLTKERLEQEAVHISGYIQYVNIQNPGNHIFLQGTNYGVFLLSKFIERGKTQPYQEFILDTLSKLPVDFSSKKLEGKELKALHNAIKKQQGMNPDQIL